MRKRCESLITVLVHQRDVIRSLSLKKVSHDSFEWAIQMRYYVENDVLLVKMANSSQEYGFEYLGVQDRLIQTPLTDRCYLTLIQALQQKLGGSPYGPAGTGKTESVKSLASQLGRHCIVFCCDEGFDFQSMGRIFVGLCKVGAWGCFDEFNRLEPNILSAVSQQIQSIQTGLKTEMTIKLVGSNLIVNKSTGIFITMNPGYAGRSLLPDNLRSLFRGVAMTSPDRLIIAQVMLFSQGFRNAELLASKIIPFFNICRDQLTNQRHYDFGLRALKSVLISAGKLQRKSIEIVHEQAFEPQQETLVLVKSIRETVFPKLVEKDVPIADGLVLDLFGIQGTVIDAETLMEALSTLSVEVNVSLEDLWTQKILQLYTILQINHGCMIVGSSGSGKTFAWKTLFRALDRIENQNGYVYCIDPKTISKDQLYGHMDSTTREWTDGIFTRILRNILDDVRGLGSKRHWIVFDGDVDPEWVENLNSVLDDNRMLTLPNGERLPFPSNARIIFEVQNLEQATPATVSRCGMVWFPDTCVTSWMSCSRYLSLLKSVELEEIHHYDSFSSSNGKLQKVSSDQLSSVEILEPYFAKNGLVELALSKSIELEHIMSYSTSQALSSLFGLIIANIRKILDFNSSHSDFPLSFEQMELFLTKSLFLNVGWAFAGDTKLDERARFAKFLDETASLSLNLKGSTIFDVDVDMRSSEWIFWKDSVPKINIETNAVLQHDIVVPTVDTLRHESILYNWISEFRSVILCGPPGSGKVILWLIKKLDYVSPCILTKIT